MVWSRRNADIQHYIESCRKRQQTSTDEVLQEISSFTPPKTGASHCIELRFLLVVQLSELW